MQKNRDIDRKLAMKDEKLHRQGGLLENEFQEKKKLEEQLNETVKLLKRGLEERKQTNQQDQKKLNSLIEDEEEVYAELLQREIEKQASLIAEEKD